MEKIVKVKEHLRKVPISPKNPKGLTIVDEHVRRLEGTYLDLKELEKIFKNKPNFNFK